MTRRDMTFRTGYTIHATWSESTLLQMVGIDPEHFTPKLVAMAADSLEDCYYMQRAAEDLKRKLDAGGRGYD